MRAGQGRKEVRPVRKITLHAQSPVTSILFTLPALTGCPEPAKAENHLDTAIPEPVAKEPPKPINQEETTKVS